MNGKSNHSSLFREGFLCLMAMSPSWISLTNRQQFSMVCTLIDHRNDVKMFRTQRAAGEWFHYKVDSLWRPSPLKFHGKNRKHWNTPLPSSKSHQFQIETKCTTFLVKMSFICIRMKNHFHIKGWALNLVLKQRPGGTRKWPIAVPLRYLHGLYSYWT